MPSAYPPSVGGVEELTRHLALALRAAGDEVEVWTGLPDDHDPETVEVRDGLVVRRFPMPLPATRVAAVSHAATTGWRTMRALRRAVDTFRPDVLHVQCFGPNGAYATALARLCRVPLVISLQGETLMDDADIFDTSQVMRASLRAGIRTAGAVTGCSAFTLDDAVARFGLAPGSRFGDLQRCGAGSARSGPVRGGPPGTARRGSLCARPRPGGRQEGLRPPAGRLCGHGSDPPYRRPGHSRHRQCPRATRGPGRGVRYRRSRALRRTAVPRAGGRGHGRCPGVRHAEPARAVRDRRPGGLAGRDRGGGHQPRRPTRVRRATARTDCSSIRSTPRRWPTSSAVSCPTTTSGTPWRWPGRRGSSRSPGPG